MYVACRGLILYIWPTYVCAIAYPNMAEKLMQNFNDAIKHVPIAAKWLMDYFVMLLTSSHSSRLVFELWQFTSED